MDRHDAPGVTPEELADLGHFDYVSSVHDRDSVADFGDDREVVGDQHD